MVFVPSLRRALSLAETAVDNDAAPLMYDAAVIELQAYVRPRAQCVNSAERCSRAILEI